jgi:hypothetical protein
MIGIGGVDGKGMQVESREVIRHRLLGGPAVGAFQIHVMSRDLDPAIGGLHVHGIGACQRGRLPGSAAAARLEDSLSP